jgi:hypothetical protein
MKQTNTNKNQDSEKQKGSQRAIGGKKLYNIKKNISIEQFLYFNFLFYNVILFLCLFCVPKFLLHIAAPFVCKST